MIVMSKMIGITTLAEILKPINKIPADKIGMKKILETVKKSEHKL